ncbi:MAG: type III pantothenate kinase [Gallicola sp.]|nr:type III pantothenate kinase [Gallicola sp.]
MRPILLVIDIGNTNIVCGIYKEDKLIKDWRIATKENKTSDEYGMEFRQIMEIHHISYHDIEDIIISSVVPNLMHTIPAACQRYLGIKPYIINHLTDTGIKNCYGNPKEVGSDRIVNAAAGYKKYGGPLIIIDIGTAITFDYITKEGEYLGGAIAPGLAISSEALFMKTSKLPKIEIDTPQKVIGQSTVESIQSGLVFGYIGLVDSIIERMLEEKGNKAEDVKILGTGGFSVLISKNSRYIERVDKMLTLDGLKMIYDRNNRKKISYA